MIIPEKTDQNKLRHYSMKMGVLIVELLMKKFDVLSKKENKK
jgi:hypothetical protein